MKVFSAMLSAMHAEKPHEISKLKTKTFIIAIKSVA
jgi:hypothetical protein